MAKPNKAHHDRCVKYKNRGQREINKKLKQDRDKKRIAHFAARKEAGKCYEYKPLPPEPENKKSSAWYEWNELRRARELKADPYRTKTEFQKWKSIMSKVQSEVDEQLRMEKREENDKEKKNIKK